MGQTATPVRRLSVLYAPAHSRGGDEAMNKSFIGAVRAHRRASVAERGISQARREYESRREMFFR